MFPLSEITRNTDYVHKHVFWHWLKLFLPGIMLTLPDMHCKLTTGAFLLNPTHNKIVEFIKDKMRAFSVSVSHSLTCHFVRAVLWSSSSQSWFLFLTSSFKPLCPLHLLRVSVLSFRLEFKLIFLIDLWLVRGSSLCRQTAIFQLCIFLL